MDCRKPMGRRVAIWPSVTELLLDVDAKRTKAHDMTILSVVLTLIVIGLLVWLVDTFVPLDGKIKLLIKVVVVIAAVVYVLQAFGVSTGLPHVRWH